MKNVFQWLNDAFNPRTDPGVATLTEQQSSKSLWHDVSWYGKKNTSDILMQKARDLSLFIVRSSEDTGYVPKVYAKHYNRALSQDQFESVFLEYLFFFIHYTDRAAAVCLNESERDIFMSTLILFSYDCYTLIAKDEAPKKDWEKYFVTLRNRWAGSNHPLDREVFEKNFNERHRKYSSYKSSSGPLSPEVMGPIFGEFGRIMQKLLNFENEVGFDCGLQIGIMGELIFLKIPELLAGRLIR